MGAAQLRGRFEVGQVATINATGFGTAGGHRQAMSVYVDDYGATFGRMTMSHMMADSTAELHAMADRIGVARRWLQKAGTYQEHYDVCLSKRKLAIANGAIEVTPKEMVRWYLKRVAIASAKEGK